MASKLRLTALAAAAACAAVVAPAAAQAALGSSILVLNGGPVSATYEGSTAGFANSVFFVGSGGDVFLFKNFTSDDPATPVGTTIGLGSFAAGTELVFRLFANQSDSYFTGPGSRNPDGFPHAIVSDNGMGGVFVQFEDLPGEGGNFDDLNFTISNATAGAVTPVPEPASWALLIGGVGLIGGSMRARVRRVTFA